MYNSMLVLALRARRRHQAQEPPTWRHTEGGFRRAGVLVLCLLCSSALACGRELTRTLASEIITKHRGLPENITDQVGVGRLTFGAAELAAAGFDDYSKTPLGKYAERGLLTLEPAGTTRQRFMGIGPFKTVHMLDVQLTDEGRRHALGDVQEDGRGDRSVTVRLADRVLGEITGIAFSADKTQAQVEFTLKYANVTPFGAALGYETREPRSETVHMQLYDDGWRVVDLF